jgi:hypothetical protein
VRADEDLATSEDYNDLQIHFSTSINAGWQKLEYYYNQSDVTPVLRAAVLLHPRMKWRWFERHWSSKPEWIEDARVSIDQLWSEYKDRPRSPAMAESDSLLIPQDEWSSHDPEDLGDQLQMYLQEPYSEDLRTYNSPIPYWINKRAIWPQLAQMALDVYSTPAMSDEPERVFSIAGNVTSPRRRRLTSEVMQWLLCLRSWQNSGVITLDQRLLRHAVMNVDSLIMHGGAGDDDDDEIDEIATPQIDDEPLYHEHGE